MGRMAIGAWLLALGYWPLSLCAQTALRGAGATFPAPIYEKWMDSFQAAAPGLPISYEPVGSEEGMARLRRDEIDFAASDILPEKNVQEELGIQTLPSVVGAVVPAYNVPGLASDLRFTPDVLGGIFLGQITKWNDERIREINHGIKLPQADIVVIHRSDGSGTTFVFSKYLSDGSAAWRASLGAGSTLHWPVGEGARGNDGVASAVVRKSYSIGYLEFIYALRNKLSYGAVINSTGKFVRADIDSISTAATSLGKSERVAGREAYPIASFTWLLIPSKMPAGEKRERLAAFLDWAFSAGQREAGALGYVALPEELAHQERERVTRFRARE